MCRHVHPDYGTLRQFQPKQELSQADLIVTTRLLGQQVSSCTRPSKIHTNCNSHSQPTCTCIAPRAWQWSGISWATFASSPAQFEPAVLLARAKRLALPHFIPPNNTVSCLHPLCFLFSCFPSNPLEMNNGFTSAGGYAPMIGDILGEEKIGMSVPHFAQDSQNYGEQKASLRSPTGASDSSMLMMPLGGQQQRRTIADGYEIAHERSDSIGNLPSSASARPPGKSSKRRRVSSISSGPFHCILALGSIVLCAVLACQSDRAWLRCAFFAIFWGAGRLCRAVQ